MYFRGIVPLPENTGAMAGSVVFLPTKTGPSMRSSPSSLRPARRIKRAKLVTQQGGATAAAANGIFFNLSICRS